MSIQNLFFSALQHTSRELQTKDIVAKRNCYSLLDRGVRRRTTSPEPVYHTRRAGKLHARTDAPAAPSSTVPAMPRQTKLLSCCNLGGRLVRSRCSGSSMQWGARCSADLVAKAIDPSNPSLSHSPAPPRPYRIPGLHPCEPRTAPHSPETARAHKANCIGAGEERASRGLAGSGERATVTSTQGRDAVSPSGEDGVDPRWWRDGRCQGRDGGHLKEDD